MQKSKTAKLEMASSKVLEQSFGQTETKCKASNGNYGKES